jgi:hypothetical protein
LTVRHACIATLTCTALLAVAATPRPAAAEDPPSTADRVADLQDEIDSLTEDIDDLREPVEEFELFDQCMYLIGVSEHGEATGAAGYLFGDAGRPRRRALALDIRGFGRPEYQFLAFPAEEPPSIECNEDAGEEDSDD